MLPVGGVSVSGPKLFRARSRRFPCQVCKILPNWNARRAVWPICVPVQPQNADQQRFGARPGTQTPMTGDEKDACPRHTNKCMYLTIACCFYRLSPATEKKIGSRGHRHEISPLEPIFFSESARTTFSCFGIELPESVSSALWGVPDPGFSGSA